MVRRTLQNEILDTIGQRIASGAFHAGQILRTEDFENEYDVSRSVLREVLKVLESMRLIALRPRIGITVLDKSQWSVFDPRIIRWRLDSSDRPAQLKSLTDLRLAVEPLAAHNAALHASPDQAKELITLAALLRESGLPRDEEQYLKCDIAFHTLLLEASGNEMFAALSGSVAAILTGRKVHHLMPADPTRESLNLHHFTAESIQHGNAVEAENAVRRLLTEVKTQILPALESDTNTNADRADAVSAESIDKMSQNTAGLPSV